MSKHRARTMIKAFPAIEKETVTSHKFVLNKQSNNVLNSLLLEKISNPENFFKTSQPISDFPNINLNRKKERKKKRSKKINKVKTS